MIVDRIFTPSLAQVAYLVADDTTGDVAVIDPRRDVTEVRAWVDERGYRVRAVLETHVHADFVSGGRELAVQTGAPLYASRAGAQTFDHIPLDDGDVVEIGRLRLQAYWTPGHTPEHMSYLLTDPTVGSDPVALFSGDALFVGEVGRPDLLGNDQTGALASQLYATVTERLATLPEVTRVYPGHTAGSSCGRMIGDAPDTTIGAEKQMNYAFKPMDRDTFVQVVLAEMPMAPTYYPELKRVNTVGATWLADLAGGEALSPETVASMQADGALVIDTRTPAAFGAGHIPGAVAVGAGPNFLTWMGWLAPYRRDLVLVVEREDTFAELVQDLRRIGLDRVSGYLAGGMVAWAEAGCEVRELPQMSVEELHRLVSDADHDLAVLDVRRADEWAMGRVAGATWTFVGAIAQGAEVNVDDTRLTAVICGTGYRSTLASSLLMQRGHTRLVNVMGGMTAWDAVGLPVER